MRRNVDDIFIIRFKCQICIEDNQFVLFRDTEVRSPSYLITAAFKAAKESRTHAQKESRTHAQIEARTPSQKEALTRARTANRRARMREKKLLRMRSTTKLLL